MDLKLDLPPAGTLVPNNDVDPLRFYYRPLIGRVFRARIDAGLALLSGRYRRLLEIGYGSGLLMPTLARVLEPGGALLIGCPAIHRAMNAAIAAIGFRGIEQHHFSSITDVAAALAPHFTIAATATWPALLRHAPLGLAPYTCLLAHRVAAPPSSW